MTKHEFDYLPADDEFFFAYPKGERIGRTTKNRSKIFIHRQGIAGMPIGRWLAEFEYDENTSEKFVVELRLLDIQINWESAVREIERNIAKILDSAIRWPWIHYGGVGYYACSFEYTTSVRERLAAQQIRDEVRQEQKFR